MKLGITILIHNKDDIEFVTEFSCLLGHPVYGEGEVVFFTQKLFNSVISLLLLKSKKYAIYFSGEPENENNHFK